MPCRLALRSRACRASRGSGFTLIEVLLVLIILVVIGSLAVNVFSGTRERAFIDATKANISGISTAIDTRRSVGRTQERRSQGALERSLPGKAQA